MNTRVFGPGLIVFLLVFDQWSKWAILEKLFRPTLGLGDPMRFLDWLRDAPARLPDITLPYTSFFNLSMVWNEGISFGLMAGGGWGLLTVLSLIISAVFFVWMLRSHVLPEVIALAMIVGGALGNVYDRVRFGAVADFVQVHWNDWYFPTFNVADSAISIGVALLLIHGLFFAPKTR